MYASRTYFCVCLQVSTAIEDLIDKHQRRPGSILVALADRLSRTKYED